MGNKTSQLSGGERITASLRDPVTGSLSVAAYLTAGFPDEETFEECVHAIAPAIDVLEVGVPFTDPMADGRTIQRTSEAALEAGVSLDGILTGLENAPPGVPTVLMSYLNPLIAFGFERLVRSAAKSHIDGLIIPDLPLEESSRALEVCDSHGVALVQLVTPISDDDRISRICNASRGFVYAVATTGITGGQTATGEDLSEYLSRVRARTDLPVLAGFGIRTPAQVAAIAANTDGIVVGSALLEAIERGEDPRSFLENLIPHPQTGN